MLRVTGTTTIVAEAAQAHDGSLGMAHAFVDAVANAGADAIKFQTHIAAAWKTASGEVADGCHAQTDCGIACSCLSLGYSCGG